MSVLKFYKKLIRNDKQLKFLLQPSPMPHPLPFAHFHYKFYFLKRIWVNFWYLVSRNAGNWRFWMFSFKNFLKEHALRASLGSSRFKRSKGALRRQKYVTSVAFTNMSATLQNYRSPWCLSRRCYRRKTFFSSMQSLDTSIYLFIPSSFMFIYLGSTWCKRPDWSRRISRKTWPTRPPRTGHRQCKFSAGPLVFLSQAFF